MKIRNFLLGKNLEGMLQMIVFKKSSSIFSYLNMFDLLLHFLLSTLVCIGCVLDLV